MDIESLRRYCLSLPHATEDIQWGEELLFRVGGKIFAMTSLERQSGLAFKCTPEKFAELLEIEGVEPAPYVGRYHWVALASFNTLPPSELRDLLHASYEMVLAKLPAKPRAALATTRITKGKSRRATSNAKRRHQSPRKP